MTRMTSLTSVILVHFGTDIGFGLSITSHLNKETDSVGGDNIWLAFYNILVACSLITDAHRAYSVLQFGHKPQENADTLQSW